MHNKVLLGTKLHYASFCPRARRYVYKMKYILAISVLFLSSYTKAELDAETIKSATDEYCSRSAIEVEISKDLFEIGWSADILVKYLSGNTEKAINQLGSELKNKIYFLQQHLNDNPCAEKTEVLDKIYPMFRVVAAVNAKTPIPSIKDDPEILKFLQQAVDADPDHYKKLTERAKEWDNGIK